jgi:L-amino acid N-acyltransferase YncA
MVIETLPLNWLKGSDNSRRFNPIASPTMIGQFAPMSDLLTIRAAAANDAAQIAAIYAHHVQHGTASFDTEPRSVETTRAKIAECETRGWPFLVCEDGEVVLGYAYATQFRDRPAYGLACEDSIYVHPDHVGKGVGRLLLGALIGAAEVAGFRQMLAVIGGGEPASVALHASHGFEQVGRMRSVGRKFGQWLDSVYMQRALGAGDGQPPIDEPG